MDMNRVETWFGRLALEPRMQLQAIGECFVLLLLEFTRY